jgi:hypothetical protein
VSTIFGALRRKLLTPSVNETKLDVRGFHKKSPQAQDLLETVGRTFLEGYGIAMEASSVAEMEALLDAVPRQFRGFAYEGAGMGATIFDSLPGGGKRLKGLLEGEGRHHVYMVYVGIGWGMARLPKFLWPDVTATDPLLRWLILDGFGFHQAYFRTDAYVRTPAVEHPFSWANGPASYNQNAIDQGIGRALWFIAGTDPDLAADLVNSYPEQRRADLWAGIGLAATYAGGSGEPELERLLAHVGEHRAQLAQGAAFAAEAREKAGLTLDHTHLATRVLCGTTPEEASRICIDLMPSGADQDGLPAYELWRRQIAEKITSSSLTQKGVTL